jgi:PAS domain S-box-containing protein
MADVPPNKAKPMGGATGLEPLRESEEMYRITLELMQQIAWTVEPDGTGLKLSERYHELTGMTGDEDARESLHPDDRAHVVDRWTAALASGEPYDVESRLRMKDGSYRCFRVRAMPRRDAKGRILRWYGITEDVEEERVLEQARRDAEEKLRESEELHRITLELSQQIAFTAAPDGPITSISPRFWELTGLAPGTRPGMAMHPDDRFRMLTGWAESVTNGTPYHGQFRMGLADGSFRYFRMRAAPRRDEEDRILRWYGTIEDVHLQREAQLARRDAEERYRLAVQATNDAVWDADLIADMISWSDNAAAILGSGKAPLGLTPASWWKERIHPEDRAAVLQSFEEVAEGEERRWSATYRFQRDDGSYADIYDRGFIIRGVSGRAIRAVGAMADLTDRHHAEAEIRRMQAELIHVSRLSAMGAMASTLAHELNQPLTAVGNFISGAKRVVDRIGIEDPDLREALEAAESGALRAAEIVRRLRELVSRGTASVMVEHLPKLIEDASVLAFLDEQMLGVRHRLDLDPAAQWVRADRVQIQQVLINLIRNAVEAMEGKAEKEVVLSTRAIRGEMVEIAVADSGVGLGAGNADSLFSQFMTTKSGGMGIGLPISRTIVEAHGGQIWGEDRPEGGAMFRFTLPRARRRREKLPL